MNMYDMDRRTFLALGVGILGVASAPAWLRPRTGLVHLSVPVMGTVAELAIASPTERAARQVLRAAAAELQRVESLMSRFSTASEVGRFNASGDGAVVHLGPETSHVIRAALEWAELSDGAFDPTLESLTRAWDPGYRSRPPSRSELRVPAARSGGWRALASISADPWPSVPDGGETYLRNEDNGLDLGGIAKGYAVDAAARVLREHGVFSGLVNVGGDLMAMGEAPDGSPWRVGVRDPADPRNVVRSLEVTDRGVATSGDYLRFFDHGGVRYHHILDPETRAPARGRVRTITVVADDVMTADAAATTAFVLGPSRAEPVLARISAGCPRIVHSG